MIFVPYLRNQAKFLGYFNIFCCWKKSTTKCSHYISVTHVLLFSPEDDCICHLMTYRTCALHFIRSASYL